MNVILLEKKEKTYYNKAKKSNLLKEITSQVNQKSSLSV